MEDGATRSKLGSSFHVVFYPEAIRTREYAAWTRSANKPNISHWRNGRTYYGLHYDATRVREYLLLGCDYISISDISVVKTRMQTLGARQQYRNALHCAYRIYTEEGVARFWTGTTPRLTRLVVSFNGTS